MLMPKVDLSALFPEPAMHWLRAQGHATRLANRVKSLLPDADGVTVDGERFDAVVLATAPQHLAALLPAAAQDWLAPVNKLGYQPIYTVYLRAQQPSALPQAWLGLAGEPWGQWVFDRQRCAGQAGWLAVVISGPGPHQALSADTLLQHTAAMLNRRFPDLRAQAEGRVIAERRATFSCDAGMQRIHPRSPWPRLVLAGDHVAGPYPATLEGAVRSGAHAAHILEKVLNC
jgi:predicted NAD/FAD-binding protein